MLQNTRTPVNGHPPASYSLEFLTSVFPKENLRRYIRNMCQASCPSYHSNNVTLKALKKTQSTSKIGSFIHQLTAEGTSTSLASSAAMPVHDLLPPLREQHYSLREQSHNFCLPDRVSTLMDKNFLIRMLYKDFSCLTLH